LDSPEATDIAAPPGDPVQEIPFGEPRWPPVVALLVFIGLNVGLHLWLPQDRLGDTDVLPLTHRAKYTMFVQSTVALALVGLVVARAVNAFT
jgi:hypothetical protein